MIVCMFVTAVAVATINCSTGGGTSSANNGSDAAALFTGSWLCNLDLEQTAMDSGDSGSLASTTTYGGTAVKTVTHDTSLSIFAQESDSVPQDFFCGFNYEIRGLTATLVGMPSCSSYRTETLQTATISVTSDGNQLSLQETGTDSYEGTSDTMSGTCSRN